MMPFSDTDAAIKRGRAQKRNRGGWKLKPQRPLPEDFAEVAASYDRRIGPIVEHYSTNTAVAQRWFTESGVERNMTRDHAAAAVRATKTEFSMKDDIDLWIIASRAFKA